VPQPKGCSVQDQLRRALTEHLRQIHRYARSRQPVWPNGDRGRADAGQPAEPSPGLRPGGVAIPARPGPPLARPSPMASRIRRSAHLQRTGRP